jgi:hypothetical protein
MDEKKAAAKTRALELIDELVKEFMAHRGHHLPAPEKLASMIRELDETVKKCDLRENVLNENGPYRLPKETLEKVGGWYIFDDISVWLDAMQGLRNKLSDALDRQSGV